MTTDTRPFTPPGCPRTVRLPDRCAALFQLPATTAAAVADWLTDSAAPAPTDLPASVRAVWQLCPDRGTLLRLICLFDPADDSGGTGAAPLLHHLCTGWKAGVRPAPWFDPAGYDDLSAPERGRAEAAILHFARTGWLSGLDPDPRRICRLQGGPGTTFIAIVSVTAEIPALLDLVGRHAGQPEADWLVLDRTPGQDGLSRLIAWLARPDMTLTPAAQALRAGRIRLVGADRGLGPAAIDALADAEAARPWRVVLPLARTTALPDSGIAVRQHAAPDGAARRQLLRTGGVGPVIDIYCPAPDAARAHRWGDFHFAECLATALTDLGASPRIRLADVWHSAVPGPAPDATLVLRGVAPAPVIPGAVNLMWMLSHSYRPDRAELNRYDHVFVASDLHAAALRPVLGLRVSPLLQCSDPARFAPAAGAGDGRDIPAHPLLFVGNSRRSDRWVVSAAIAAGHDPAVYGAEWEDTPVAAHLRGTHVPNTDLALWYRRADIVLNDHWPDMAARGFVSNRLFDIGMAGGFVISDRVEGSGILGDGLVTVGDARELDAAIRHFLRDRDDRRRHAAALHRAVRDHHTFADRAATIMARLRQLV